MSHFTELRRELENYLDSESVDSIYRAYRFAAQAHKGQERHSGDPYIVHPLAVAQILAEMRMDAQTITAAILHDVIEDTPIEKENLEKEFSPSVAELVDGVSKLTQIQFRNRQEAQAENFRKMLLAMAKDIRVILIKLADRLHNMRTLNALPQEKRERIARETLEIYAPIANRLGMHAFRVEFEDLGFATLYPVRYRVLQDTLSKIKHSRKSIISHLESNLRKRLENAKLPPSVVWARDKHLYSLYKEMKEKHVNFNEAINGYTFCIVVDSVDTCYRVLGLLHNLYKPRLDKFRDYIALPKANGYQALHTTLFGPNGVPLTVQIRTIAMDNIADSGIATHWLINTPENTSSPAHVRAGEWLKRLLDIQQATTENPLEFIENVKIDLFPEEVYVFTPKGDILELPKGATPVDLAYAVHSDIGNACIGAKVDRRLVALSTHLASGQTVEIITDPTAKPNPSWLNFVITGKARSNIRHFLKAQHHAEAIDFGHRLLDAALTSLSSSWEQLPKKNINYVLKSLSYNTEDELFEAIGLGVQVAPQIAQHLLKKEKGNIPLHSTTQPLIVKGSESMLIHFASCCSPIPGDPIISILNPGRGVTIHVRQCKQIARTLNQSGTWAPANWDDGIKGSFKVNISLETVNQPGVLAQLATAIATAKANIENISTEEKDGNHSVVNLTLAVRDRVHLAQVMRRLRSVRTVTHLARIKT